MPKPHNEKSVHLQKLEATFEQRTRRFSPFEVLGLNDHAADTISDKKNSDNLSTHMGVDTTHPHDPPTSMGVVSTPIPGEGIHTPVVVSNRSKFEKQENTTTDLSTHMGVDTTHPPSEPRAFNLPMQDILAATQLRPQLGQKARQVLAYLNSSRSADQPAFTKPLGYSQISAVVDVHPHYLRRNVLPKLAMIGLIGIAHKSFQGTIYHLYHDSEFIKVVVGETPEISLTNLQVVHSPELQASSLSPEPLVTLPSWVDREHWPWLNADVVQRLITKAGSEEQAWEKLDIMRYNETHGPQERRIRDRHAVLLHYLRAPQADIWPNDDGYLTLAVQHARQIRDQAVQEKALAEETLQARQEAARLRFVASLTDSQLSWLKTESKQRVDMRPESRFLQSRYPLYKAEEDSLILEWMDRSAYGENVPHLEKRHNDE